MSEKFYSLVTKIGQAQFANALALDQKVAFGTFAVGDGGGSIYDPSENQTDLKHEVWSGKITSLTIGENNPNELIVETYIPSNKGGFAIREFGIKDSEGNLLVVGKHPETYKPVAADGTAKDITLRVILAISNASEVILKIDPSVQVATRQDLEKVKADFDGVKGSLASKKDFKDFKTSFEEEKKDLASKKTLDKHIGDTSLHTTKEDKAKLKAIPTNPKYTDTTYTFDKGLSLANGKVSAKLGDGLVFDTAGSIKADTSLARKSYVDGVKNTIETKTLTLTDGLAKDLRENVARIDNDKADKKDLNGYVAKVSGKGLSTNDFTNTYKSNIDKNLRDEADVMRLALKVARRDTLFKSKELYKDLNNYYGTSLSSSIRTLDDFQKSPTAMAQLLNNEVAKREMESDLAYSRAIFEAVMPYFKVNNSLDNLDKLKQYLKDDFYLEAIATSPRSMKFIIDNDTTFKLIGENTDMTYRITKACPYIKHGLLYFEDNMFSVYSYFYTHKEKYREYLEVFKTNKMILLGYYGLSGYAGSDPDKFFKNVRNRNGESLKLNNSKNLYIEDNWKRQVENKKIWLADIEDPFVENKTNENYRVMQLFNYIEEYGYVECDGVMDDMPQKIKSRVVYLDLEKIEQDIARGL